MLTRRHFGLLASGASAALAASACGLDTLAWARDDGRLKARPKAGVRTTATGKTALRLGTGRDGLLVMPANVPDAPMPLFVLLHGANGSAERQLARFGSIPNDSGVAVLAIDSRSRTWDAIMGLGFSADVEFINLALEKVFGLVAVDPKRLTIGGFSDGATYGLSLGLFNGDLFTKIVAFSTGFLFPGSRHGKPRVFMSHGTSDDILPIDQCGRPVAADLRKHGYDVTFREFAGKHEVPPAIATEAFGWIESST